MATELARSVEESPSEKRPEGAEGEVSLQLSAPSGWNKKVIPRKGRTPGGSGVLFIAPNGEEIKNKRQLDQYLKSNPGSPASSEFDWSTGETPRRSVRISGKVKAIELPEDEPPKKKRGRKPLSEKKKEEHEEKEEQEEKDEQEEKEEKDEQKEKGEHGEKEEHEEKEEQVEEEHEKVSDAEMKVVETEKEADAKPADEKVGDAEMKDAEPVKESGDAVNPASDTTVPDQNSGEKVEENNEAKPDGRAGHDTVPLENNIGAEAGPHEGSIVNGN